MTDVEAVKNNLLAPVRDDTVAVPRMQRDRSEASRAARKRIMLGAVFGEFVATFIFLYVVAAANINLAGSPIAPLATALVAGFMLMSIAFAFAEISGAHVNPAVTFATWLAGKTSNRKSILYVLAQLTASILAMCMILATFPKPYDALENFALVPAVKSKANAFWMEFMLTFIFVFIIFTVAFEVVEGSNDKGVKLKADALGREIGLTLYQANAQSKAGFAPFAIGATCTCLAMMGGSVSGGAFNPARVFGPAVVANVWKDQWIYWLADFAGAACAAGLRKGIKIYLSYSHHLAKVAAQAAVSRQVAATSSASEQELVGHPTFDPQLV